MLATCTAGEREATILTFAFPRQLQFGRTCPKVGLRCQRAFPELFTIVGLWHLRKQNGNSPPLPLHCNYFSTKE